MKKSRRHCEERSDEAISAQDAAEIASHSLAMTGRSSGLFTPAA
jgi:hypothetical protein